MIHPIGIGLLLSRVSKSAGECSVALPWLLGRVGASTNQDIILKRKVDNS